MTSKQLSQKLADAGVSLSAATVRKDWSAGAPRSSAEAYMRWRQKNIATDSGDLASLRREKIEKQIAILEQRRIADERANKLASGELVENAWVVARFMDAGQALKALYHKAVAEHPVRLAALTGDVSGMRAAYKDVWDEIFKIHQSIADQFEEHENEK